MKKNKRVIFNGAFLIIVFVLTIYGVFHGEDLGAMMDAIRSADKRWLVPGLALVAFFIWGESIIIWYMMRSYGIKLKKRTCFLFSSVGFFFSCITPVSYTHLNYGAIISHAFIAVIYCSEDQRADIFIAEWFQFKNDGAGKESSIYFCLLYTSRCV